MSQGKTKTILKHVSPGMLDNRYHRLDVGNLDITDFSGTKSDGFVRCYGILYKCTVSYQNSRNCYYVTFKSSEKYAAFLADNGIALDSSVAYQGYYDKIQEMVYITVRLVLGDVMLVDPATNLTVPLVVPAKMAAGRSSGVNKPRTSTKKVPRAPRVTATVAGEVPARRRLSSRLAAKQEVAAALFAAPSPFPSSSSVSINEKDEEFAGILFCMEQEITSAAVDTLEEFALLAKEGEVATAVTGSIVEYMSPPKGEPSAAVGGALTADVITYASQTSSKAAAKSILGKRKAEEDGSSLEAAAGATELVASMWMAQCDAVELGRRELEFDMVMSHAEAALGSIKAARLAEEKKRRKVSHVAAAANAPAFDPSADAPAAMTGLAQSSSASKKSKKGAKTLNVASKVATKKFAANRAGVKTAAKKLSDACTSAAMDVDASPSFDGTLGSMAEDGIRKSRRISARRSAAARTATQMVHRRKRAAPAPAAFL